MAPLKDWMDKRSERKQAAKANNDGKSRPDEEAHDPKVTTTEPERVALDDFSNIPPPPKSRARGDRLVPPTSGLSQRNKGGSQTQARPSSSASPAPNKTRTPSPKGSAFSEHFDRQSPKTVTRVNGVEFEMSITSEHGHRPGSNNEGDRSDIKPRRSSRSQTRRQERADSHQMLDEDAAKMNGDLDLTLNMPDSLQVGRKFNAGTPSPPAQDNDSLQRPTSPRSGLDEALRQLSSITSDPSTTNTEPLPSTNNKNIATAVTTSPSRFGPSPFMQRLRGSLSKPTTNVPPSSPSPPLFTPPADTEPDFTKFIPTDHPTVAVRPPVYDLSKAPAQQWESELGSTSCPARAWDWTKRWTCCQCQGQTIVEQIVCGNLQCVHDRCPEKCRVIKWARPKGDWVMKP
ncbi:hypothetical protein CLAFUW4_05380 [Fulvia fulva]|uniref:Uncharacterized protein n=1 Tax=Passalora fulva TaxID=5499 RepID=A0A9Q8LH95_PASFU|nr:uncharacterized protein CLAFUR5_05528 [Fulvia fulva]KAK4624672.1 hypothetical protein CLAFUR4_05374 [Fulvia fulva]KAK4625085.1 hypothetical protein CLAFUR0_05382 [Fulvia fulva]UJO17350.1 hypothetical protein CLAFUR5_05528 [Fulvia fulva]WPV15623.1 hypothetical protein CLAFUW4_05380 [Fulvia fulva]WPV29506.1 hypothetical protein CLAFUW7_05378 [Fulvia fulva]